ncbi:MAG: Gfo/Idh/MocA family protein [Ramlibacter sp.]
MHLRQKFGRPLRLGVIGGGPDSWIGRMHRGAAEMDGWFRVTAGVLSSDRQRSLEAGIALGLDPARSHGSVPEMLAAEAARPDGIDAVAIMTPNDTHYGFAAAALDAGLDVVCDKPVAHDFAQAVDLVRRARARDRLFAVAHGYSAYPMTRHARQLVRDGAIARCAWCRSSTSSRAWPRRWKRGRRPTACAGSSIPRAAGRRWS